MSEVLDVVHRVEKKNGSIVLLALWRNNQQKTMGNLVAVGLFVRDEHPVDLLIREHSEEE